MKKKAAAKKFAAKKRGGRRRGYKTINVVGKSVNPIPQRYICKMKYADTISLGTATSGSYEFNLNSVFDPNRTGVGHQPYGHDQLATLFNRYRVIGCSYHVSFPSVTSTIQYACFPANEIVAFSSVAEMREQPRARYAVQMSGGSPKTVSGYVSIPSLMGRTKAQYMADDRFQAAVGANPLEQAILNIRAASVNEGSVELTGVVTLEYTVEWFDQKHLSQS